MNKKVLIMFILYIIIFLGINSKNIFAQEIYSINVVQKGDYITYNAGVWKKEEIDRLVEQGIYYYNVPSGMVATFSFSEFDVGTSKDIIINKEDGTGWRILSNENGVIKIISEGTTEKYYLPFGTNKAYIAKYELTGEKDENDNTNETEDVPVRDWGVYENPEYAVLGNAHLVTGQEIFDITGSQDATDNNLRNIGENYITSTAHCNEDMWTVEINGHMDRWGNRMLGIRPVIHLKNTLKVIKMGQSSDGYNIWKLLSEENISNVNEEKNEETLKENDIGVESFKKISELIENKYNYQKKINQADSKTITTKIFSILILFFTIIAIIYVLGKR